jgi:hypothetical protein
MTDMLNVISDFLQNPHFSQNIRSYSIKKNPPQDFIRRTLSRNKKGKEKKSNKVKERKRFAVFQYNWGKFVFLIPRADRAIAGTRIND